MKFVLAYGPAFNYTLLTKEVTNFTIIAHDQYGVTESDVEVILVLRNL